MASETLNRRLRLYLKAEEAILIGGQSYTIGNRTLTRADLDDIQDEIARLRAAGAEEDGMGNGRRRARMILFD